MDLMSLCDVSTLVRLLNLALNGDLSELAKAESTYISEVLEDYEEIKANLSAYQQAKLDRLLRYMYKAGMAGALRQAISKYHLVDKFRLRLLMEGRNYGDDQY
ncbi:MAG: hypothetical protein DRO12_05905 [Thermoprotei archaeon]|nr:MAG: hypothetical protein DRO12_05905 [Thermoprotei archaeon]